MSVESPCQGSIWMKNQSVNLYSSYDYFIPGLKKFEDENTSPFPGWKFSYKLSQTDYSMDYKKNELRHIDYQDSTKKATIFGPIEDHLDGLALGYVGFWMMEAQRQKQSIFTMHSSALTVEDKGLLILGQAGSGKTTLLLDLCNKTEGEIISNDLTFVENTGNGRMNLIDGTKSISLRLSSIEANFPNLRSLFIDSRTSSWINKIIVGPEDIGIRKAVGIKKLDKIVEIHLDGKKTDPLKVSLLSNKEIKYRLYEDMSRIIRGSAISVFGNNDQIIGYMPSLDDQEIHNNRIACIESMIDEAGIYHVSGGNLNEVSSAVYRLVSRG